MTSEPNDLDCCPGAPGFGDPNGMHTHDCPAYLANVAAFMAMQWAKDDARAAAVDHARLAAGTEEG